MNPNYNNMHNAGAAPAPTNPFEQVLDNEAYSILTKCDPKLAVAVLSIAVKKFSKDPEFIHFLKEEFKSEFENIDITQSNPMTSPADSSVTSGTNSTQNIVQPQAQPAPSTSQASPVTVAW